ncbi:MAG: adenylosuccinate synthase [Bernardetiaceae bacterium]
MDVLLGLQWGDEGKGKVVDFLAPRYETVARFQGGPNAGHTLVIGERKHVLHQIPSGIFHPQIQNLIGNGMVLDLIALHKEIMALQDLGLSVRDNLTLSRKAHLILPTHRLLDRVLEQDKGADKIGSTLKGIGPAYQDKYGRTGLRVGDLSSPDFANLYQALKDKHLAIVSRLYPEMDTSDFPLAEQEADFWKAVRFFVDFPMADTEYLLQEAVALNQKILAEGAQGTLLDVDFGSFPFVTSSSTSVAGACTGLGMPPRQIEEVFGIFKAYCTRVGSGPFPTELHDQTGERLRAAGHEFGATTGRPRRCGWLDLPALKYAIWLNGVTQLFMMKIDVLTGFDTIQVCTHYRYPDGRYTDQVPFDLSDPEIEPLYKTFKGWKSLPQHIDSIEDLPFEVIQYINFLEEQLRVPIVGISYGPEREATLLRHQP